MYADWLGAGIRYQYVSAGVPIGQSLEGLSDLVIGATLVNTSVLDIPMWDEEGGYSTFNANSYMGMVSASALVAQSPSVSIGMNVKVYHDRILDGFSLGVGVDLGIWSTFRIAGESVQVGIAMRDVGRTRIAWHHTAGEPVNFVPWITQLGVSWPAFDSLIKCAASYEWALDRPQFNRLRAGAELTVGWIQLRLGWNELLAEGQVQWTFGVGLAGWKWMSIDYTLWPTKIGVSHLIGIEILF